MSPNLELAMEKRSPEYFDNPAYNYDNFDNDLCDNSEITTSKKKSQKHQNYLQVPLPTPCKTKNHDHTDTESKPKPKIRKSTQIYAAIASNMGAFALGAVLAWSATALPSLRLDDEIGDISKEAEAWIGSIVTLGAAAGCPAAAYSMVSYGRRKSMLLLTAPFVAGWLLIGFAEALPYSLYMIYFGRLLTGFCGGAFTILSPVFIAEAAHVKIRGGLAAGFDLMLSIGMLYIYIIGAFWDWKIQAFACAIIPIITHVLMLFVPESPRFLVEVGKVEKATKALSWFFGLRKDQVGDEMDKLTKSVIESQAKPVNFRKVVMKLSVLKPILICLAILFFYTMSAIDAIIFYAVDIFKSTGSDLDPKDSTMILGAVQVVATIPAAFIVDKCGRRLLLMISELFMCLSLIGMGVFFFVTANEDKALEKIAHEALGWLPLVSLNIFLIAYSIGIGPLALMMMGELVPSHIKGMTSCGVLAIRWILGFGVTNLFETLETDLGPDVTYWIFAGICGVGVIFVYFCVPETKGKTLDEIQIYFISADKLRPSLTPLALATSRNPSNASTISTNDMFLNV